MTCCVLDASLAVELALYPRKAGFQRLLNVFHVTGVAVPGIWHWEFTNVMLKHERRRRTPWHETDAAIDEIRMLVWHTEEMDGATAASQLTAQARSRYITLFDAAHLQLAIEMDLPLATLDAGLGAAAELAGVALYPLTP